MNIRIRNRNTLFIMQNMIQEFDDKDQPLFRCMQNIIRELDDKDKLSFRCCSQFCGILHASIMPSPPYHEKIEFLIGVGHKFYTLEHLDGAWEQYCVTLTSTSFFPAMLYKLCDYDYLEGNGELAYFSNGESLSETGRRYNPVDDFHCWDVNQVWMLAQLHKERSFVIFSDLSPDYAMRANSRDTYSAFSREVATALKADYSITINQGYVQLNPPASLMQHLTLNDIEVTKDEIADWIDQIHNAQIMMYKMIHKAISIKKESSRHFQQSVELFNDFAFGEKVVLAKINFETRISKIFDYLLVDCQDRNLAVSTFIENLFTSQRSFQTPGFLADESFMSLDPNEKLQEIKNYLLDQVNGRIWEYLKDQILGAPIDPREGIKISSPPSQRL